MGELIVIIVIGLLAFILKEAFVEIKMGFEGSKASTKVSTDENNDSEKEKKGMGLFKSREEKDAERIQRAIEQEKVVERMSESPLTKAIQAFFIQRYGDLNGEEVCKLRQLAAGGGRAGCIMRVHYNGIELRIITYKGETIENEFLDFDSLGFENLPSSAQDALKEILLQTLSTIPHLEVSHTGFFMYNQNRVKQSW